MKKKYLFILALAATVFAACSSNEDITSDGTGGGETLPNGGAVTVKVNLPQVSGTRFPELDDGDPNEYAVTNAFIALYVEADNGDTVCIGVQKFSKEELRFDRDDDHNDKVTSTSAVVTVPAQAKKPQFALAIINVPDEVGYIPQINHKYWDFIKENTEASDNGHNDTGFLMTNSNFVQADDLDNPPHIYGVTTDGLQKINPASISSNKNTPSETPTQIYVERVSAKVKLNVAMTNQVSKGGGYSDGVVTFANKDQFTIEKWDLTVTNKSYFPVKHIDATEWNNDKYQLSNDWSEPGKYRTYWAKDPNYTYNKKVTGTDLDKFNYVSYDKMTDFEQSKGGGTKYCMENTFDVKGQNKNTTTTVIIAGTYKLASQEKAISFVRIGTTAYIPDDAEKEIAQRLNAAGYKKNATPSGNGNDRTSIADEDITVEAKKPSTYNNGEVNITCACPIYNGAEAPNPTPIDDAIKATFGATELKYYTNGMCFYAVPIRNFLDEEVRLVNNDGTPFEYQWNGGQTVQTSTPDYTPGCLGRYGVVRNTSYTVNINSISGLGQPITDPTEPTNPDPEPEKPTPDDDMESAISAQINILPWAVRTQDVDL